MKYSSDLLILSCKYFEIETVWLADNYNLIKAPISYTKIQRQTKLKLLSEKVKIAPSLIL